ncbi:UNVERIFIED_CONTAM: hypothetical protein FKN15_067706, partial [Acipenser sinensis]
QLPHFINSSLPDHERITAQQIDSYFRQELIYKRNERMGRRITELLEGNPGQAFFFAFGAGRERNHHGYDTGALFKSGECPSGMVTSLISRKFIKKDILPLWYRGF